MNCRHCSQLIVKVYDKTGTYYQHNHSGLRFCDSLRTYAELDMRINVTADTTAYRQAAEEALTTFCPITHSSLAHTRANLQFTNHVSITFIRDVRFCPSCGEKLLPPKGQ